MSHLHQLFSSTDLLPDSGSEFYSYKISRYSGVSVPYTAEFRRQDFLDDHLRNGKRVVTAKFHRQRIFATITTSVKHFLDAEIWPSSLSLTSKFGRQATNSTKTAQVYIFKRRLHRA